MATHLTTRWGKTISNPNSQDLASALGALDKPDDEHPDCWLSTEDGWSISVFQSGLVIFENIETGEGPWHMKGVSRSAALELWQMLQSNDLLSIQTKPWDGGYGNT